ncbi:MAG: hypothetical protein FGM33_05500 [Candidatus Kapabacteria bacterium]|nr:hypothetical protein [Candidatus Kapabacteria bacterium]
MQRCKILFICGSANQTTMMVDIARHLGDHQCFFTPHYADGMMEKAAERGLLEWTIIGKRHRERARQILRQCGCSIDECGRSGGYDLVVTCSDLVMQRNIVGTPTVLVQEGMTDPENLMYKAVVALGLPRYLASTATFGLSHMYRYICVASEGYRRHFRGKGVDDSKIRVTGIPNFDNCAQYLDHHVPHERYVLVATSDARETLKYEDRRRTIERAKLIAAGRQLVFKLHPNERISRATAEIMRWAPGSVVYHDCDINPLIAHCDVLVTKFSSCVYVGIALGKEVYSEFPVDELVQMCPMQNGGTSAQAIAAVCNEVLADAQSADIDATVIQFRRAV